MDNNKKATKQALCEICGSELAGDVCPQCNWVQINFPGKVPAAIVDFNAKRREIANKIKEEKRVNITETARLKKEAQAEADRLKMLMKTEAERMMKDRDIAVNKAENQRQRAEQAEAEARNAKSEVRQLASQNKILKSEKEAALTELERIKRNPPTPAGAQIRISENNGKYTLHDTAGVVHRQNGERIGKSGIELYDGYVFKIGELSFTVGAPEIDFDNLII